MYIYSEYFCMNRILKLACGDAESVHFRCKLARNCYNVYSTRESRSYKVLKQLYMALKYLSRCVVTRHFRASGSPRRVLWLPDAIIVETGYAYRVSCDSVAGRPCPCCVHVACNTNGTVGLGHAHWCSYRCNRNRNDNGIVQTDDMLYIFMVLVPYIRGGRQNWRGEKTNDSH